MAGDVVYVHFYSTLQNNNGLINLKIENANFAYTCPLYNSKSFVA
jgi:hypothetical protein